jgi:hypothetical protein
MTKIVYRIGSHTGQTPETDTWTNALELQEKTRQDEIAQLNWWPITCVITNNDGSITMTPVDSKGNPTMLDSNGDVVPYVDTTTAA